MTSEKNIFSDSQHLSTGQLLDYLRHRLAQSEKRMVERHLSDCELCSDALDGLKNLNDDSSMLMISKDLQKIARKRFPKKRKIFSGYDMIGIYAIIFLIFLLIAIAFIFFWRR